MRVYLIIADNMRAELSYRTVIKSISAKSKDGKVVPSTVNETKNSRTACIS
jgi:hypothetical protein